MSEDRPKYAGGRYGQAGKGISGGAARYGKDAAAGARGERVLSGLLRENPLTHDYAMWQSLRIPTQPGETRYSSDVDLAVASGNRLVLVDAKFWAANHVFWTLFGMPMRDLAPMPDRNTDRFVNSVGPKKQMSRNMELAVTRYSAALPAHSVLGIVVFAPTKGGLPTSVGFLRWPGGIRSFLPQDGMRRIHRFLGDSQEPTELIQSVLGIHTR